MSNSRVLKIYELLVILVLTTVMYFVMTDNVMAATTVEVTGGQKVVYQYYSYTSGLQFKVSNDQYCEVVNKSASMYGSQIIYELHVFPKLSSSLSSNTIVEVYDPATESNIDVLIFHVTPPTETRSLTRGRTVTLNFTVYKPYVAGDTNGTGPVKGVTLNLGNGSFHKIESFRLTNDPINDYDGVGGVFKYEYEAVISIEATGQFNGLYLMTKDGFVLKKLNLIVNGTNSTIEMNKGEKLVYEYCSSYSGLEFKTSNNTYCEVAHKNTTIYGSYYVYYLHIFPKLSSSISNNTIVEVYNPETGSNADILIFHATLPEENITIRRGEDFTLDFTVYKPYEAGDTSGTGPVTGISVGGDFLRSYKSFELINDPVSEYDGIGGIFTYKYRAVINGGTPGQFNSLYVTTSDGNVLKKINITITPLQDEVLEFDESGDTKQLMYTYIGSNIQFVSDSDSIAKAVVLQKTALTQNLYSYQIGFASMRSNSTTRIRAYNPDTGQYLDTFLVKVYNSSTSKSTCVNHDTYFGIFSSGTGATRIEATGPGVANIRVSWNREIKPFEMNYYISSVSVYYRYLYGSFTQAGEYTVKIYDSVSNTLDAIIYVTVEEHDLGNLTITKAPTCIETGIGVRTCSKCEDNVEETIPKSDHTYDEDYTIDKEPTCTENGFKSIHCSVCGTVKDNSTVTINSLGHEYGDLVAAKEATCTESGMKAYYQCSRCNKYFDADKNETTEADLIIEPIGHAYGDLVEEMPATCTEDGVSAHYQCSRCEQYFDINKNKTTREALTIKATHQYGKLISKNATCTEDGLKGHYQCSVCEKYFDSNKRETTLEDLVIPAVGHQYGSVLGNVPATCTEDGMEPYYQCSKCRKYFDLQDNEKSISEFIIKAFGHSYEMVKDTEKAPTCIYEGKEADWKCSGCGDYIEGEKIKALGHDWGEWEETEPSSCIQEGEMARKCKNDPNHVQYKGIDKLSHVMNKIPLVKATDKSEGINECWQCSLCKRYFSDMSGAIRIGKEDIIIPRHKMTVKVLKKVFTAKAKKKTTIKRSKAFAVYDAKQVNLEGGVSFNVIDNVSKKVTYKRTSGNKKIVVSKNGNITIKKGLKKGKTYKVRVKVTLKASALYATCSKTVTVKIKAK